jgi:hypothetical protein
MVETRPAVKPAVLSMVAGLRPWRFVAVMGSGRQFSNYAITRIGRGAEMEDHVGEAWGYRAVRSMTGVVPVMELGGDFFWSSYSLPIMTRFADADGNVFARLSWFAQFALPILLSPSKSIYVRAWLELPDRGWWTPELSFTKCAPHFFQGQSGVGFSLRRQHATTVENSHRRRFGRAQCFLMAATR